MPLYDYICDACGHRQEHLQKRGASPLTHCPQCHAQAYRRQLAAPAFVLKGSGWYASDFRNNTATTDQSNTHTQTQKTTEVSSSSDSTDNSSTNTSNTTTTDTTTTSTTTTT